MEPLIPAEIDTHYSELYDESARFEQDGFHQLELIRTKEIVLRHLPDRPARVLDVGGGPGIYSVWLEELGHSPTLIDPVKRHVDEALVAGVSTAVQGDARRLEFPDRSFDVVLLLGPLYHLPEGEDRLAALTEARRVLSPGGVVMAAAISRFASAIDGLFSGFIDHDEFEQIAFADLETGRHVNDTGDPRYFTTAYLHRPEDLSAELAHAGFEAVEILAVEGVAWAAPDVDDRVADAAKLEALLDLLRRMEAEPSLLGASPHMLAIGKA